MLNRLIFVLLAACSLSVPAASAGPYEPITLPKVPDTLVTPLQRANYIIENFWDGLDFATDPRATHLPTVEQHFADFAAICTLADQQSRVNAFDKLLRMSDVNADARKNIVELAEKYFYQNDSPAFDEDIYAAFLNSYINDPAVDPDMKIRPGYQLEAISKNRPGTMAADFGFTTVDDASTTLSAVKTAGDLLLIFYDPDCDHCMDTVDRLSHDDGFKRRLADGTLTVVAIYSGDDSDFWKSQADKIPAGWINGYDDGTLQDDGVYIIRTMPTLYLLDNQHRVILKEPALSTLLQRL